MEWNFYDDSLGGLGPLEQFFRCIDEAGTWLTSRSGDSAAEFRRLPDPLKLALTRDMPLALGPADLTRELVAERGQRAETASPASRGPGRLLSFFPEENLSDGAAEVATRGFFRWDNTPAWDTWVAYFEDPPHAAERRRARKYLVCFVPRPVEALVQAGIDVNPELCIEWLGATETRLTEILREEPRAAGLL